MPPEKSKTISDQAKSEAENLKNRLKAEKDNSRQEELHLNEVIQNKQKTVDDLEKKVTEMESALSSIQKIRVRERELENRLELVKMEGQAYAQQRRDDPRP